MSSKFDTYHIDDTIVAIENEKHKTVVRTSAITAFGVNKMSSWNNGDANAPTAVFICTQDCGDNPYTINCKDEAHAQIVVSAIETAIRSSMRG